MRDLKWFDSLKHRDFDNGAVLDEIAEVFKAIAEKDKLIEKIIVKINKVTSHYRHHKKVPDKVMVDLCNYQITLEKALEGEKCPKCGTAIEVFDSDNDWCPKCRVYKPAGSFK